MHDVLLSTREAAMRLRRSEQWVRNAARDGDLPATVEQLRGGRTRLRFSVDTIERYLESHHGNGRRPGQASDASHGDDGNEPSRADTVAPPAATDSVWLDHYREELTRYRLKIADLERTIDDLISAGNVKDDEIRRLCGVVRTLLPAT